MIKAYGIKNIKVKFLAISVLHAFHVANVGKPILGANLFAKTGLLVDVKDRQLVWLPCLQSPLVFVPAATAGGVGTVFGLHASRSNEVEALLDAFPEILVSKYVSSPPLHSVVELSLIHI